MGENYQKKKIVFKPEKRQHFWPDKALKDAIVNRAGPSFLNESLREIAF